MTEGSVTVGAQGAGSHVSIVQLERRLSHAEVEEICVMAKQNQIEMHLPLLQGSNSRTCEQPMIEPQHCVFTCHSLILSCEYKRVLDSCMTQR
jgi:hypothetical protein